MRMGLHTLFLVMKHISIKLKPWTNIIADIGPLTIRGITIKVRHVRLGHNWTILFEDGVTLNSTRYTAMVWNFLRPSLPQFPGYDNNGTWFQQDSATAHTAAIIINAVTKVFPGTVISINGDIPFPPRSRLTACYEEDSQHLNNILFKH